MAEGLSTADGRTAQTTLVKKIGTLVIGVLFVVLFGAGLISISQDGHPLSIVDEHIHFDTAVKAAQGEIPFRGSLLGPELVNEWACGVGHEGGPTSVPCGDPELSEESIPSGKYSTGYIHYPTFFFAAAAFQPVWQFLTGEAGLLSAFRAFSAVVMLLGVALAGVFGWLLGLRGARLLAATALPVASSMIVITGVTVNPTSTSVLTGVLIGGTGLLWIRRDRGFVWFAAAVAISSAVAVTSSLPAGGFLIAMLIVLIGRRRWPAIATGWHPRWWQFALTSAFVLIPVVVWGRVIAARATIPNDTLYSFIPPSGKRDIIAGAAQEISLLHTPWRETLGIKAQPDTFVSQVVHAFSLGGPTWITTLVFGGLVFALLFARRLGSRIPTAPNADDLPGPDHVGPNADVGLLSPLRLVALGTLITVILYPPALRVMNWMNFGFDHPIVERYSSALAPVLALVLILMIRNTFFSRSLAVIGILVALGTVAGAA